MTRGRHTKSRTKMAKRKLKPWAAPHEPAKRKKFKGIKHPPISPELKQYLRELDDTATRLNAWASGEPLAVEDRGGYLYGIDTSKFWQHAMNYGSSYIVIQNKPRYFFSFGTKKTMNDVFDIPKPDPFNWKKFLKTIPDLKGQIIGSHTVVWGHKITFKKFTNPILSRYGDTLSENAGMTAMCECGWMEKDILPKVVERRLGCMSNTSGLLTKPVVDFQLLEKAIMEHIQGTYEEVEYIVIPLEFLEDIPDGFRKALLSLLKASGAVMHLDFDTRNYLIIDDAMPDSAIAELTEMLAGYEVGTRKVRVLRNG